MKKVAINSTTILQEIDNYTQKFDRYGIGRLFFNKLSFPNKSKIINKKIIEIQLKEEVTRQSIELNMRGYVNLLIDKGFPALLDVSSTSKYEIKIEKYTIRFLKPKKDQKFIPTSIQENGAVFVFNRSLEPNVEFKEWQDILNDEKTKTGLTKIFSSWGEVPESWVVSYFKQEQKLFKEIGKNGWEQIEYKESNSIMSKIKELLKNVTIDSKNVKYENWNPSDIWIVKNKKHVLEELGDNLISSKNSQTLKELNDKLLKLIKEKRLIGVSLKKVPAKQNEARFVYVNISPEKSITFGLTKDNLKVEVDLNLKLDPKSKTKMVESTSVKIGKYSMQIKSNSGSLTDSSLKFESGAKELGGRGGKAPLDYVNDLMKDYRIGRLLNDWRKYPSTQEEFTNTTSYKRIFNVLKTKSNIELGINTYDDFHKSMLALYSDSDKKWHRVARIKLMEMVFIYQTTKLKGNLYFEFWKDLVYLSIKEGPKFSPHGKLY